MKRASIFIIAFAGLVFFAAFIQSSHNKLGFAVGTPEVKSISALAFGPNGILFIGDSKSATVFAIDTKDNKAAKATAIEVGKIDQKIAAALGTEAANVKILDMAVNPVSRKVYFAVQAGDGTPVLLRLNNNALEPVTLKDVFYQSAALNNAPAEDAKDQRGRSLRVSAISDIDFSDGKVLVSGISNLEFASTFRSINFPFNNDQAQASLEMYHASHGRFETASPIRTFTTTTIDGKKYLVASYTCTPLVLYPLDDLKPGTHVKGRTVAEMGSGNTPVDMLSIKKGNDNYLLMANTAKPVALVDYKNIAAFQGTLTERVAGTAGVSFTPLAMTNVLQMDKLDDKQVLIIQRKANGDTDLWTANDQSL